MKTVIDFVQEKFPITKRRMGDDVLNSLSGYELVELINEYLASIEENDYKHADSDKYKPNLDSC